ncbi:hypothetical protein [Methylorubrum aminovorans]
MIPLSLPYPPGVRLPLTHNREEWLTRVAVYLRPWFEKRGHPIPTGVKLSVGSLTRVRSKLGVCWVKPDQDGNRHIVISPFLDDAVEVADTLCHELVHAMLPPTVGHKKLFNVTCEALGLTRGSGTTRSAGPELRAHLAWIVAERAGPYPHSTLSNIEAVREPRKVIRDLSDAPKPEGAVRLRLFCPGCKSIISVNRKTFDRQPFIAAALCESEKCSEADRPFDIQSEPSSSKRQLKSCIRQ